MATTSRRKYLLVNSILVLLIILMFWYFLTRGQTAFLNLTEDEAVPGPTAAPAVSGTPSTDIQALQAQLAREKAASAQIKARAREKAQRAVAAAGAQPSSDAELEAQKQRIEQMIAEQLQGIKQENQRLALALAEKDQEIAQVKQQNTELAKRLVKLDDSTQNLLAQLEEDGKRISRSDQDYLGALQADAEAPAPAPADTDLINRVEVADSGDTGSVDSEVRDMVNQLMANKDKDAAPASSAQDNVIIAANTPPSSQGDLQNSINALMEKNEEKEREAQFQQDESYLESLTPIEAERSNETRWVTVRTGDTLYEIAQRVYNNGDLYYKIFKANPQVLDNPDRIEAGQRLRVPL